MSGRTFNNSAVKPTEVTREGERGEREKKNKETVEHHICFNAQNSKELANSSLEYIYICECVCIYVSKGRKYLTKLNQM